MSWAGNWLGRWAGRWLGKAGARPPAWPDIRLTEGLLFDIELGDSLIWAISPSEVLLGGAFAMEASDGLIWSTTADDALFFGMDLGEEPLP